MGDRVMLTKFGCEQNIERYERLLRGHLTELERDFVERRLAEEKLALRTLMRRVALRALAVSKVVIGAVLSNVVDVSGPAFDLLDQVII